MDGMEGMRNVPELNYLTQIIFLLFEDLSQPEKSDHRYRVFIHFSPGVRRDELIDETDGKANIKKLSPEMSSRTIQSQIVKRFSGNVPDSQNIKRKVSAPLFLKSSNSVSSETPEIPRSKELVVRRLSEVAPNQRASSSTCSGRKMSWTSGGQAQSDGRIKSFSETEILAQRQRQKRSTCALQQLKEALPIAARSRSMNAFEDIDKEELKPHDQFTVRLTNNLGLSKDSNALKVGSTSPIPTIVMEQGSSEKLNKQDTPKTSSFGERG